MIKEHGKIIFFNVLCVFGLLYFVAAAAPPLATSSPLDLDAVIQQGVSRVYLADLAGIVDGDTMDIHLHVWSDTILVRRVRLAGIDTPELRPRKGTPDERAAEKIKALAAKVFVTQRLTSATQVYFKTFDKSGPFGRVLGTLYYQNETGVHNLSTELLVAGHAMPWKKKAAKKKVVPKAIVPEPIVPGTPPEKKVDNRPRAITPDDWIESDK